MIFKSEHQTMKVDYHQRQAAGRKGIKESDLVTKIEI